MFFRKEFDSEQERSDCTQERRCRLLEKPTAHSLACSRFAPVLNRARFPQILVAAEPGYVICRYFLTPVRRRLFSLSSWPAPPPVDEFERVEVFQLWELPVLPSVHVWVPPHVVEEASCLAAFLVQ